MKCPGVVYLSNLGMTVCIAHSTCTKFVLTIATVVYKARKVGPAETEGVLDFHLKDTEEDETDDETPRYNPNTAGTWCENSCSSSLVSAATYIHWYAC